MSAWNILCVLLLSLALGNFVFGLDVPTKSLSFELPARAWPKRSGWDWSHLASTYLLMQGGLADACSAVVLFTVLAG